MSLSAARRLDTYGPLVPYGNGATGVAAPQLKRLQTPWGTSVQVHRLIADHTIRTMKHVAETVPEFVPRRSDSFVPRTIRGSAATSLHAYGLACDWFLTPYSAGAPAGGVWTPYELQTSVAKAWRAQWKAMGWRLGADYEVRVDLPHIEWVDDPPPATIPPPPPPTVIPGEPIMIPATPTILTIGPLDANGNGWYPAGGRVLAATVEGAVSTPAGDYPQVPTAQWEDGGMADRIVLRGGAPGSIVRVRVLVGG